MKSNTFLNHIFQLASLFATAAWLSIFIFPSWTLANLNLVTIPVALLCLIYVLTLFLGGRFDEPGSKPQGHFFSMGGVLKLFQHPRAVLVGWVHFLAFDLVVGLGILVDASQQGFEHWWILPSLFLTLMLGPAGLLSYLGLRFLLI